MANDCICSTQWKQKAASSAQRASHTCTAFVLALAFKRDASPAGTPKLRYESAIKIDLKDYGTDPLHW